MTPDEMIEVIQGWACGRGLQWKLNDVPNDDWSDILRSETPSWNFKKYSYRIKPEPKKPLEVVMFVRDDGMVTPVLHFGESGRATKFREVL